MLAVQESSTWRMRLSGILVRGSAGLIDEGRQKAKFR